MEDCSKKFRLFVKKEESIFFRCKVKMRFLFLFFQCFALSLFAKPLKVEVSAASAILINADTGKVVFEKEARGKRSPASITKIATALYALEKSDVTMDEKIKVSFEAIRMVPPGERNRKIASIPAYWLSTDSTLMGLKKGELCIYRDLFYGLMLPSGNDAANVIAERVGGNISTFMDRLNSYLNEIGCKSTHFMNPHGMYHPEHYTTAFDMANITRKAIRNPFFREIVSSQDYLVAPTNLQAARHIRQFNSLVLKNSRFYYPYAIGVKTGYLLNSKFNLVAAAKKNDRTLIAVLMGCEKSQDRFIDARHLFEAAFSEKKSRKVLIQKETGFKRKMQEAKTELEAELKSDLSIETYPSEEGPVKLFLHWDSKLPPIKSGEQVGEIWVIDEEQGEVFQKKPLFAKNDVNPSLIFRLKKFIRREP